MIVAHCVSGKVACVAKRCESFFLNFMLSFRGIRYNMGRHEVIVVQVFRKGVFSVTESFLIYVEIKGLIEH